ncbi:MAG: TolC family protein [Polyangiaceae bacterium]
MRVQLLSLYTTITAVLLLASTPARATQPLDTFVSRAKTENFDAKELEAIERQRDAEAGAALGRILPALTARGVYTRNQYESAVTLPGGPTVVISPLNQLDAYAQVDVPLFDAAGYYRWKSAKEVAHAAGSQRNATQLDVTRAITRSYFQFLGAAALASSATNSVQAAQANLSYVESRREAGAATDLDKERARANVERARQDVADAELVGQLAGRSLETLSGVSPTPAEPFAGDDLHDVAPLAKWEELAGDNPAEHAARELSQAAADTKKSAAYALLPTLTASAQEHFTNAAGFVGHHDIYTLQVIAAWRFDFTAVKTASAQAAASDAALVRQARSNRAVDDAIFEAYQRVVNGIVKSRSARAQTVAANKASELAVERYQAGVSTQLDVTQAQRDAFLAEASRIQADTDLAFARASLRLAAGRPPSDPRNP